MTQDLWAAYLATVIDVTLPDGSVRRLEQQPPDSIPHWPFDDSPAWIMTACNPRSVSLDREENARRHAELGRQLRDLEVLALPNTGFDPVDPTWSEPGYTIVGLDESQVVALAREWEQNAVFGWWPDRWELIGVLLPDRSVHSWRWAA